jgi:hypothetical protein
VAALLLSLLLSAGAAAAGWCCCSRFDAVCSQSAGLRAVRAWGPPAPCCRCRWPAAAAWLLLSFDRAVHPAALRDGPADRHSAAGG